MTLSRLVYLPLALLGLSLTGCASLFGLNAAGMGAGAPQTEAEAKERNQGLVDDAIVKQYDDALVKQRANPKDLNAAVALAGQVQVLHELGIVTRRKDLASTVLVANVDAALDGVAATTTEDQTVVLMARGGVYRAAGRIAEAVTALESAFKLTPKAGVAGALLAAYDESGAGKDVVSDVCAKARPNATSDEALYGLLFGCIKRLGRDGLPFKSAKADLAFYDAESARQDAENRARDREEQAAQERRFAEMDARRAESQAAAGRQSSGASSPGGGTYSLSLKNECPKTVRLFFGQKPKFGSGTTSSIGANTLQSKSGSVGDLIWIVDASDNGVASYSPRAGSQSVVITSSCTGFAQR